MKTITWKEHVRLGKLLKKQKELLEKILAASPYNKTSAEGRALSKAYEINSEVRNELDEVICRTEPRGDAIYVYYGSYPGNRPA